MPHNYKNYVHLEGLVHDDAVSTPTEKGMKVTFTLSVRETTRAPDGSRVDRQDLFAIEINDATRFMASLRKGTPVTVDAQIRLRPMVMNGVTYQVTTIKAHRVHSVDFNGWRKETGSTEVYRAETS